MDTQTLVNFALIQTNGCAYKSVLQILSKKLLSLHGENKMITSQIAGSGKNCDQNVDRVSYV